jgi:hypothetical protein
VRFFFLLVLIRYLLRIYLTEISYFYLNMTRIHTGDSRGKCWSSGRFTHYEIFPSTHGIKGLVVTSAGLDVTGKRRIPAAAGNWSCLIPTLVCLPTCLVLFENRNMVSLVVFLLSDVQTLIRSGRAVKGVGLRALACWDCEFESHPEHGCLSVSECCVLSGRGLGDDLITRPEESYRLWCVVACNLESSWMRRSWTTEGCRAKNKQTDP